MHGVLPACGELRDQALAFLYAHEPADERNRLVADLLAAESRGELSLDDLFVACRDGRIVGVVWALRRPGNVAFLWPPTVQGDEGVSESAASELLQAVSSRMDTVGVVYTHCLLRTEETAAARRLARTGYPHLADMLLVSRPAESMPVTDETWQVANYGASLRPNFVRVVEQACRESRDFPQLAGLRTGEQTLESHERTGSSATDFWRLYRDENRDAGVLLAGDHPEQNVLEIAYLGVVPALRRRGLGRTMLCAAISLAAELGRGAVEAAVDAGNLEALALYHSLGFAVRSRLHVHLRAAPAFDGRAFPAAQSLVRSVATP